MVRTQTLVPCGFEMDRDTSAAINVLSRGFEKRRLGRSEGMSSESQGDSDVQARASVSFTPVETGLGLFTSSGASDVVDGKRVRQTASSGLSDTSDTVVETGSPTLKESVTAGE